MKNLGIATIAVALLLLQANSVYAKNATSEIRKDAAEAAKAIRTEVREEIRTQTGVSTDPAAMKTLRNEIRNEIKTEAKEKLTEMKEERKGLVEEIKDKIKKAFKFAARINGTVTTLGENTLTVTDVGKVYTVNIGANTQLRRNFWGKPIFPSFR